MKFEKMLKLPCNFHDKEEYVIHIRKSKQSLNHRLKLYKMHKIIKFDQNTWWKAHM